MIQEKSYLANDFVKSTTLAVVPQYKLVNKDVAYALEYNLWWLQTKQMEL